MIGPQFLVFFPILSTSADFAQIFRDAASLALNFTLPESFSTENNGMVLEARSSGRMPDTRSRLILNSLQNIDGYGCWCYLHGNPLGHGRGQTVNEIDTLCRQLQEGYICVQDDLDRIGKECIPSDTVYQSGIGANSFQTNSEELLIQACKTKNPMDECKQRVCIVEGAFVTKILDVFFHGAPFDASFKHSMGFDPEESCQVQVGGVGERECCGDYPNRSPYRSMNGNRDCCNGKTFSTERYSCCRDGTINIVC